MKNKSNKLYTLNEETFKTDEFKQLFITTLNSHVPIKATFLRGTYANFITKELTKAIDLLKLINLRNKYLNEKSDNARFLYKTTKKCTGVF